VHGEAGAVSPDGFAKTRPRAVVQGGAIVPRASGLSVAVRKGVLVVTIYTAP